MTSAKSKPWRGIYPIAPTPFTATGDLDLDGQRRVLDCMIDQGVDGICILANYSEQFLLTDDERDTLLDLCLGARRRPRAGDRHRAATSARASPPSAARARPQAGAAMLMLMPPYHGAGLRADENGMLAALRARRRGRAASRSWCRTRRCRGVALSVPFLVRLAREVPLRRATSRSRCRARRPSCAR